MKKMCIFMMCGGRNSEHIIGKTLDSMKPVMNHLVFQDNGIKDNAGKIVKEWCIINDMKLHYYEVEWKNPGWNREHSYNVAVGLYNEHNDLLVVGKLGQPTRISDETDTTFILRWDT